MSAKYAFYYTATALSVIFNIAYLVEFCKEKQYRDLPYALFAYILVNNVLWIAYYVLDDDPKNMTDSLISSGFMLIFLVMKLIAVEEKKEEDDKADEKKSLDTCDNRG
jgi:hypothetical protein